MSQVYVCEKCRRPIAVGKLEAGALQIKCKSCGYKTLVIPEGKAA